MKKLFLLGSMIICSPLFSQNVFPTEVGSNVGIGTSTPSSRLQVTSGTSGVSGVRLTNLTSSSTTNASNSKGLSVDSNGNVILVPSNIEASLFAINTATSATSTADYFKKAHVFGAGYPTAFTPWGISRYGFNVFDTFHAAGYRNSPDGVLVNIVDRSGIERYSFRSVVASGGALGETVFGMVDGVGNEIIKVSNQIESANTVFMHLPQSSSRLVIGNTGAYLPEHKLVVANGSAHILGNILTDSNIGIGTSNFTDGTDTYRLSVNGAIRASRVKVYTTWADYVFESDYRLPTLQEVEQHITENGHLKDIPSAADVEANGIELGEMNKLLLQKIEELTLYVIQLNKELENMKIQVK